MKHFRTFEYVCWKGRPQGNVCEKDCDSALLQLARDTVEDGGVFDPDAYVLKSIHVDEVPLIEFADAFKAYLLSEETRLSFVNQSGEDENWLIVEALLSFMEQRAPKGPKTTGA